MARAHVVTQQSNVKGNAIGRAHKNPTLDISLYQVEYPGGKVTELSTNVIVELMYTQFNAEGSKYFVIDLLIDHCMVW